MTVVDGNDFLASVLADDDAGDGFSTPASAEIAFEIKKFLLQILLEKAATVIPSKEVMEVLKNFQFQVLPDRLRVVASDLELSMVATTEMVTVTAPGTAVFPAKKMLDIVRQADDGVVKVRVRNGTAAITVGRTSWNLRLKSGSDYPRMPDVGEVTYTTVDRAAFAAAMHAVRYAVSKEASRDNLRMIDVRGGTMTACDGARFQQAQFGQLPFDFRIPLGAVDDLTALLKKTDLATIAIGESANHLIFRFGSDVFIANKLQAKFPDMEATLLRPALANKHQLSVDRAELLEAVKRVRINADPETSAIGLSLTGGQLTVMARDKYGNDASETVDAAWSGKDRTLVVNHAFLADMINGYASDVCTLYLGDDAKTRKSVVMLKDPTTGTVGVLQQMVSDWVGMGS